MNVKFDSRPLGRLIVLLILFGPWLYCFLEVARAINIVNILVFIVLSVIAIWLLYGIIKPLLSIFGKRQRINKK